MRYLGYLVALLLLSPLAIFAHDMMHPELNGWFSKLTNASGGYCCDGTEANHVADADWRVRDGHYEVRINQYQDGSGAFVWVAVKDSALINQPNKDGRTLVWPIWGNQPSIRCFLPGPGM